MKSWKGRRLSLGNYPFINAKGRRSGDECSSDDKRIKLGFLAIRWCLGLTTGPDFAFGAFEVRWNEHE